MDTLNTAVSSCDLSFVFRLSISTSVAGSSTISCRHASTVVHTPGNRDLSWVNGSPDASQSAAGHFAVVDGHACRI
jgi:hypothetical protein